MPVSVGTRAEETIVGQVIEAVEEAISVQRLTASEVVARSGLSRREIGLLRKLQVRPSLRTLLVLVHSVGLELDIRVRAKRRQLEDAQLMESSRNVG